MATLGTVRELEREYKTDPEPEASLSMSDKYIILGAIVYSVTSCITWYLILRNEKRKK